MPNDGKTTMDVYQRFPKNRKTLGVRWLKRHGVTAPIGDLEMDKVGGGVVNIFVVRHLVTKLVMKIIRGKIIFRGLHSFVRATENTGLENAAPKFKDLEMQNSRLGLACGKLK